MEATTKTINTTERIMPIEVVDEAEKTIDYVGNLDMSDQRIFFAFIHGIEYKEMMDLSKGLNRAG